MGPYFLLLLSPDPPTGYVSPVVAEPGGNAGRHNSFWTIADTCPPIFQRATVQIDYDRMDGFDLNRAEECLC